MWHKAYWVSGISTRVPCWKTWRTKSEILYSSVCVRACSLTRR